MTPTDDQRISCAAYSHPHSGNCRCLKLCVNCGLSQSEHLDKSALIDRLVELLYEPAQAAPASRRLHELLS